MGQVWLAGVVRRQRGGGRDEVSVMVLASAQVGSGGVGVGGGGGGGRRGRGGVEGVIVRAGERERFSQVGVRTGSSWVLGT